MPQFEHDPSPTPQLSNLTFDPVFERTLASRAPPFRPLRHWRLQFLRTFSEFWSPKATSAYRCWQYSFNTASHKTSGLSSPVFASSIILLAVLSHRMLWSPS